MTSRVQFLICGTQKGGTTALAGQLREHPDLCIPAAKELHFFDDERQRWQRPSYNSYHNAFRAAKSGQVWGEATPIYMYWDQAARRIWEYNPEMKIIVVLRNPISRAYSHWSMEVRRGAENLSFEQALDKEAERCRQSLPLQHRVFSYQDRGLYSNQLRRLWHFFGRDAVLVLRHEALKANLQDCLDQICHHLRIRSMQCVAPFERHVGHYSEPMSDHAKQMLRRFFWHEICQLETLLQWNCQTWLES